MLGHQGAFLFLSILAVFAQDDLKRWSNDDIEIIRTATPEEGKPLVFAAKHSAEYNRTACYIYLLAEDGFGHNYYIADGLVSNGDGDVVDWMEVWDDGQENTCGITILDRNDYHGDVDHYDTGMSIHMTFSEGGLFGQPKLNRISTQIHVRDDLFTNIGQPYAPQNYDLTLVPDLLSDDPATHYTGNMKVTLEHESHPGAFPLVSVHNDGLNIRQLNGTLEREDGSFQSVEYEEIQFDLQKGKVMLTIDPSLLTEEDILTLDIDFEANIDPSEHTHAGLYKELCSDNSDKFCWFTQFESTSARYAFPCIDEPNKKATFDIKVARTEGWNTLSNMPIEDTVPVKGMDGWVWDIFQTTPVMSTYLIAFAIQDFAGVQGENEVTIWANKEDVEAGLADYSQDIGPKIIDFYGSTFGIPYSLPKMDMVSVPKKGGAMENWGLILYSYDTLMYDQESPDVEKKWRVLEVVAHELAHQWFGNLVTMDWWDQTWLNEGFASYVSHLGADAIDPDSNSWGRMVTHRMFQVMKDDSSDQSWALSDDVKSRQDIGRKFGSITYSKGASVIRMMESILGYYTLLRGLYNYLNELQFSNSVEEDLFFFLEAAGLQDGTWPSSNTFTDSFEETMKTWTNQAGYPLVTVEKEMVDGHPFYKLTQSWYRDGVEDSTDRIWDIPITAKIVGDPTDDWEDTSPLTWLAGVTLTIPPTSYVYTGPLILNKKAMGYYRVNYDDENWSLIAKKLMTDHEAIHPLNRAQIICDVMALARTGHVTEKIKDEIMEYIDMETDFTPLNAVKECSEGRREGHMEERI